MGPYVFTALRLITGAAVLMVITAPRQSAGVSVRGWWGALPLFVYALGFSLAYVELETGVGALLLFAAVQLSMVILSALRGQRYSGMEWVGVMVALAGLAYLLSPRLTPQPPLPSALMILAGAAWGVYTILGQGGGSPIAMTKANFQRAAVLGAGVLVVAVLARGELQWSWNGVWLAVLSGSVTSGLGYVLWYAALRGLTTSVASSVQLAVPLIAATGGVVLVGERVTITLVFSAVVILGGIGLTILGGRSRTARSEMPPAIGSR